MMPHWDALFTMGDLFRRIVIPVAEHFGFDYPLGDDERVSAHLRHVRDLPRDAKRCMDKKYVGTFERYNVGTLEPPKPSGCRG